MVFLAVFAQEKEKGQDRIKDGKPMTQLGQIQYGESPIDRVGQTYKIYTLKVYQNMFFFFWVGEFRN
jgi:hypothetical protein